MQVDNYTEFMHETLFSQNLKEIKGGIKGVAEEMQGGCERKEGDAEGRRVVKGVDPAGGGGEREQGDAEERGESERKEGNAEGKRMVKGEGKGVDG